LFSGGCLGILSSRMPGKLTEELRRATRAQSALRPVQPAEEVPVSQRPFRWVALVFVVLLAVGGFLLMRQLRADSKLQDCVMSGRRNCAPVP
jgi:hypothetical protein